jgi:2-oxoglutarate dehydrogenase E1 component
VRIPVTLEQEVIDDINVKASDVKRVLLFTGKIYYELLEEQEKTNQKEVALVRLEQMYPTPFEQLDKIKTKYKNAEFYWVQEEPENMGAWPFISRVFRKSDFDFEVISRKAASSPATGFAKQHQAEQAAIIAQAFDIKKSSTDNKTAKAKVANLIK